MGIKDYFSSDTFRREKFIFNTISPFYHVIQLFNEGKYRRAIKAIDRIIGIRGKKVLDVGCATGVWTEFFRKYGASRVVGVDLAEKMVRRARKNYPDAEFYQANALDIGMFENSSFDIVTASYVLHGPKRYERNRIVAEMLRVASEAVVIHDFDDKPLAFFPRIIEKLERSNFEDFQKTFFHDIKQFGYEVVKYPLPPHLALYVVKK